jgi:hypothetical protein
VVSRGAAPALTLLERPGLPRRRPGRRQHVARCARALCLALVLLPAVITNGASTRESAVRAAAQPYEFHLLAWEAQELAARLPDLLAQMVHPPTADSALATPEERAAVRAFFAAAARWQAAHAAGEPPAALEALRAEWLAARPAAEAAIARALAVLASQEGLTTPSPLGTWLLPPVSFLWSEPPQVLVVSPRDRIEVAQSVLLRADLTLDQAEALERAVEALDLSALVVRVGGIATYPAIVPLQASPTDTLATVAHEWLHGYLFFHPLGRAYFGSYDARAFNETVADLAGRELGTRLAAAYGLPAAPPAAEAGAAVPAPDAFDFRREMRATRLRLDELLAAGRVAEAERYLAERREAFVAAGYPIRKLNQAYFAFHGSYGESPAAVGPLDGQVRQLRAQSASLGDFLRQVAQMTSTRELALALGQEGGSS